MGALQDFLHQQSPLNGFSSPNFSSDHQNPLFISSLLSQVQLRDTTLKKLTRKKKPRNSSILKKINEEEKGNEGAVDGDDQTR